MSLVAQKTERMLQNNTDSIVGLGASGSIFASTMNVSCQTIDVKTLKFDRERKNRILEVNLPSNLPAEPILVDDVMVSGKTLGDVSCKIGKSCLAAVGLAFKSKSSQKRANVKELIAGLEFCREGGGYIPLNSIDSLKEFPDRLNVLTRKYFLSCEDEFKQAICAEDL